MNDKNSNPNTGYTPDPSPAVFILYDETYYETGEIICRSENLSKVLKWMEIWTRDLNKYKTFLSIESSAHATV